MPSSAARTRSAPVVARVRPRHRAGRAGGVRPGPGRPGQMRDHQRRGRIRPGRLQRGLEPVQPDAADAERPVQDARAVRASGPQSPPRRARLPGQREPGRGHLAGPRPGQRCHHRLPGAGRHQGAALLGHAGADGGARAVPAPGDERAPARQAQLGGDPRPDPAERRGPGDDVRQQAGVEAEPADALGRPRARRQVEDQETGRERRVDRGAAGQAQRHQLVPAEEPPRPGHRPRRLLRPPQDAVGRVHVIGDVAAVPDPPLAGALEREPRPRSPGAGRPRSAGTARAPIRPPAPGSPPAPTPRRPARRAGHAGRARRR